MPQNEPTLKVGVIGCGGRGTGAAENCLTSAPNVQVVALADMFRDRLDGCRRQLANLKVAGQPHPGFKVEDPFCFTGFDAYKRVLDAPVDLVIIAGPPGFRPLQFAAAVEAGKHVFSEKPVCVDPAGYRRYVEAGRKATAKKLGVVAGTQRRHQKPYVEVLRRIHEGAIGDVVSGRCTWNQGGLWSKERKPGESEMEWQIRNWLYFDWLSGDHIVEQHIHNVDVINWVMRTHPVRATAVGGRQVRTAPVFGNIYDHFGVDFEYPNGVHVLSMCRQQDGTDGNVSEFVVGTKGRSNCASEIWGEAPFRFQGKFTNPYVQEHTDLIESIRAGRPLNEAQQVAESSLSVCMGRHAAYTGKVVAWDEFAASDLDYSPPKYEIGPLPVRPVPMPGRNV